ncbi:MAG: ABC transporter permease [Oscillospiraceae bacterium]|jgi:simple sugar transport system permease protein|nr:ABC transporter permease [Oscillospiraceae bacterium]
MKKRPHIFTRLLGDSKLQPFVIPVFSVVCSLAAASIVLLIIGRNPLIAFRSILQGAGLLPRGSYSAGKGMLTDLLNTLSALTPMIFAALGVTVAFKAGLFNIGVSGQMLFAGYIASVTIGYSDLPAYAARPLVLLIGFACGALIGALIGLLKHRFNINEVVSSIMINYILQYVIGFFILTRHIDPVSRQSVAVSAAARLVPQSVHYGTLKGDLPLCILLAIIVAFILRFVINRTRYGFDLLAVGANPKAARYAGIRVGSTVVTSMTLSGALAGLAGVTHYLGYYNSIQPKSLTSVGFDSIAVSLLGNGNPVGVLFSSLLVTVIDKGSTYMSSMVKVEREIAAVITGLILLFSACGAYFKYLAERNQLAATGEPANSEKKDDGEGDA